MLTSYRAVLPGVAALCSLVAFILALCCLLAGTNPKTLQGMELFTLNTSKLGATIDNDLHLPQSNGSFNFTTLIPRGALDSTLSSAQDGLDKMGSNVASDAGNLVKDPTAAITDLKNNITQSVSAAKQQVSDEISKAEDALKNATGQIISTFINETIQSFHIHDFYVGHLTTYCEGNYTSKGKKEVTFCSNHKPDNKYNTNNTANGTAAKTSDDPFAFIENLHLPDPVEYALKALTLLGKIISAFYIVGIIALFATLVSSAMTIPLYFAPPNISMMGDSSGGGKRTILRWATLASSGFAFFTLLLASTMVHFLCKKLCELFESHPAMGVAAYPGNLFLGCSWASVIFVGLALVCAVVDLCVGMATNRARNKLGGAGGKFGRKWFGKNKAEKEEYEI